MYRGLQVEIYIGEMDLDLVYKAQIQPRNDASVQSTYVPARACPLGSASLNHTLEQLKIMRMQFFYCISSLNLGQGYHVVQKISSELLCHNILFSQVVMVIIFCRLSEHHYFCSEHHYCHYTKIGSIVADKFPVTIEVISIFLLCCFNYRVNYLLQLLFM